MPYALVRWNSHSPHIRTCVGAMPNLIMPSVQVNIRGGRLPEPEDNGVSYIKIPVNAV